MKIRKNLERGLSDLMNIDENEELRWSLERQRAEKIDILIEKLDRLLRKIDEVIEDYRKGWIQ